MNDADCPTCGPTALEQHPRRANVLRCRNCAEWLWLHVNPSVGSECLHGYATGPGSECPRCNT